MSEIRDLWCMADKWSVIGLEMLVLLVYGEFEWLIMVDGWLVENLGILIVKLLDDD